MPQNRKSNALVNGLSLLVGLGFSACLFLLIARYFGHAEEKQVEPPREDLDLAVVSLPPPPPPPPRSDERSGVTEGIRDVVTLGLAEEPSASPIKIAPSPPSYEELLPPAQVPAHVVAAIGGLDSSFKPEVDLNYDNEHVFHRSEVDKPPFVVSRPTPEVPGRLLSRNERLSVLVLFVVDTHGVVGSPHVLRSSGVTEFDTLMLESVREWAFSPAIRKGKPVRCIIQQPISVSLSNRSSPFSFSN